MRGKQNIHVLSISLPFEFLGPVPGKFMVGAVGHFTLQPMASTNHKLPTYRGAGCLKGREIDYSVALMVCGQ